MHAAGADGATVVIPERAHHQEEVLPVHHVLLELDAQAAQFLQIGDGIQPRDLVLVIQLRDGVVHIGQQHHDHVGAGDGRDLHGPPGPGNAAFQIFIFHIPALVLAAVQFRKRRAPVLKIEIASVDFAGTARAQVPLVEEKHIDIVDMRLVHQAGIRLGAHADLGHGLRPEGNGDQGGHPLRQIIPGRDERLPGAGEHAQQQDKGGNMQDSSHINRIGLLRSSPPSRQPRN